MFFQDHRYIKTTKKKTVDVEEYFQNNPNSSTRKAAQASDLNRETLTLILKNFLKLHPFKIYAHC